MRFTVKLGGSILEETSVRREILDQIATLKLQGSEIIVVHGGGKSLNRRLAQLNLPARFVNGLRVTDAATLGVALMVLAGEVNKGLVVELGKLGIRAVGICGADARAIQCVPLAGSGGYPDELGFVGRPVGVDRAFFELLLQQDLMPVVSSLALGDDFQLYNINADQMASVCAWGTSCQSLVYLTDVPGVRDQGGKVLSGIGRDEIRSFCDQGVISGGMLPKTQSCLEALDRGVRSVYILPGSHRDILRKFVNGSLTEGTCIYGQN